jgi:hypothetical protein
MELSALPGAAAGSPCSIETSLGAHIQSLCTPENGISGGCPFVEQAHFMLGVCSDTITTAQSLVTIGHIATIRCWASEDTKAVAALELGYKNAPGLPATLLGDQALANRAAATSGVALSSVITEIRMWYSTALDKRKRAQIGRLYIKLASSAVLDCGDTSLDFNRPDSRVTSQRGFGPTLAGVTAASSYALGSSDTAGINALQWLIAKQPTASTMLVREPPNLVQTREADVLRDKKVFNIINTSPAPVVARCQSFQYQEFQTTEYSNTKSSTETWTDMTAWNVDVSASTSVNVFFLEVDLEVSTGFEGSTTTEKGTSNEATTLNGTEYGFTVDYPPQVSDQLSLIASACTLMVKSAAGLTE